VEWQSHWTGKFALTCALIALGWIFIAYGNAVNHNWFYLAIEGFIIPRHLAGAVYGMTGIAKSLVMAARHEWIAWAIFFLMDAGFSLSPNMRSLGITLGS